MYNKSNKFMGITYTAIQGLTAVSALFGQGEALPTEFEVYSDVSEVRFDNQHTTTGAEQPLLSEDFMAASWHSALNLASKSYPEQTQDELEQIAYKIRGFMNIMFQGKSEEEILNTLENEVPNLPIEIIDRWVNLSDSALISWTKFVSDNKLDSLAKGYKYTVESPPIMPSPTRNAIISALQGRRLSQRQIDSIISLLFDYAEYEVDGAIAEANSRFYGYSYQQGEEYGWGSQLINTTNSLMSRDQRIADKPFDENTQHRANGQIQ